MDVADEIPNVHFKPIRDWGDSILLYIVLVRLTSVSLVVLVVEYALCILNTLTPVISILYTVLFEVFLHCFIDSVSLRELGKSTLGTELSNPNSLYPNALTGAL